MNSPGVGRFRFLPYAAARGVRGYGGNQMAKCIWYAARALAVLILGMTLVSPASAQDLNESQSKDALRERQAKLFDSMIADPQNLDAMFAYAGVSARLEDYEAAISTLERMLIFNADLPRVRLELGALYFRIGAYPVAQRYFESVAAVPGLPEDVGKRVDTYLAQIEKRQQPSRFNGQIEVGFVADTNATLGPQDRDVLLFGQPALLDNGSVENDDIGGRVRINLSHRYDLGRTNNDTWQTDASYLGRRYESEDRGNLDAFYIRTGPNLSLNALNFGPKLRPYVDAEYVRADDRSLYRGAGAGLRFRETPTDQWSIFGDLRGGYRDYASRDDEDGIVFLTRMGVGWLPARDTVITATITGQRDHADEDFNSNSEGVLRLSASFAYDPGFSFVDEKWVISAYASAGYRQFDDPDPVVSRTSARKDRELRIGASHVYNFKDGFYASVGATALWRDSNLPNYDLDNFGVSAAVGYTF